ncbi:hypothetical protein RRG08_037150 [Elysia crispata]|uniref:Uncharacterized protein n=1 Tax=Elysia crispata TaxID=231223 RepID=A0AAE1A697_9GAST|nr:hypothetical protein RRG08_037150 [Elysia crispata]
MSALRRKIQNLFEELDSCDSNVIDLLYQKTYLVIQLSRYYPDPRSRSYYGFDDCQFWDLFDITLADGKNRRKFVASADIVRELKVYTGSQIQLKIVKRFWEHGENGRVAVMVIRELEILNEKCYKISDNVMSLPLVPSSYSPEEERKPLASNRLYYMDNWTFNLAPGQHFGEDVKRVALEDIDLSTVCQIKDIIHRRTTEVERRYLLVKVMRKSRLIHYVNRSKEDKWPFQLPLMVADRSGWCCAVMWNNLAVQLLDQFHEGSILLVKNVRVKPSSFQQKSASFLKPPSDASLFSCELSMDIRNPKVEISLVDFTQDTGQDLIDGLSLPQLELRLMSRIDLISVPDLSVVDVEGLIIYVSRVEREHRKARVHSDSGGFFYRRWLHLKNYAHDDPIVVQVYSGDQLSTFDTLQPGQYVLCRHMLSNQQLDDLTSSRQKRHQWLVTTATSKIYIVGGPNREVIPHELRKWLHVTHRKNYGKHRHLHMEGGVFRYPPYTKGAETLLSSEYCERLESYENSLTTRGEYQRLIVIANFKSLHYVDLTQKPLHASRSTSSPKKKARTAERSSSKEEDWIDEQIAEDLINLWPICLKSKKRTPKAALKLEWQETEPVYPFTVWKPCAVSPGVDCDQFENLEHFLAGQYDCEFGLVGCARSFLEKETVSRLTQSTALITDQEFVLLVDAYTNEKNQKILVLDRAFRVR